MFRIVDVRDVGEGENSIVDEGTIDRRRAAACLGKLVQDRTSLRDAVEHHSLSWSGLVPVCGAHAMDFFLGATSPALKVEAPTAAGITLRRLFSRPTVARGWAGQVDATMARRVRGTCGAHREVRVTYEHLLALKFGPVEVAALCGEIDHEFRVRAGLLSEENVRNLGWSFEALAWKKPAREKKLSGKPRIVLDV
ncbi:hypothetical protein CYMTET_15525 [Cymbomonas tetramitiformis]|uniref:Uncharacterized protein n=1 Tax=Cymbomonas tetramitiformis TaxID=36881 RepID=A0AAE0GEE8_9CHLO|nr:hypothetical protein CYMTET_15525 [Cymbomonas tetramitiformis]